MVLCRVRQFQSILLFTASLNRANIAQEAATQTVDLEEDDWFMINLMLIFLYTADYEIETEDRRLTPLQLHAQMYSLADKYSIGSLMELAVYKYRDALEHSPDMDDYLSSISHVYVPPASNNVLRNTAVAFGRKVLRDELKKDNIRTRLGVLVSDVPEFACDLIEAFACVPVLGTCATCGPSQVADALSARCRRCRRGGISDLK